jgi:cell division transport system ATP-binding protein
MRDTGALETRRGRDRRGESVAGRALSLGKTQTFGWFVGQVMKKTAGAPIRRPSRGARAGARAPRSVIELYGVSKKYGRSGERSTTSLRRSRGEFVFLTGPPARASRRCCGCSSCEEAPTEGQILVNGRNTGVLPDSQVPYLRRTMGVVFQDFKLVGRKTVFENISFVQNVMGLARAEQKRRAYHVLKRVGLQHQMNAYPDELSGGEQQRVAIARAIVNEPTLLLADEPTGNLDPVLSEEIMRLFVEITSAAPLCSSRRTTWS